MQGTPRKQLHHKNETEFYRVRNTLKEERGFLNAPLKKERGFLDTAINQDSDASKHTGTLMTTVLLPLPPRRVGNASWLRKPGRKKADSSKCKEQTTLSRKCAGVFCSKPG